MAGLVGSIVGPSAGGLFLAFPAILPATLTLIDEKDGKRSAEADALGAVVGSAALAAFGMVSWLLLPHIEAVVAELAALVGSAPRSPRTCSCGASPCAASPHRPRR